MVVKRMTMVLMVAMASTTGKHAYGALLYNHALALVFYVYHWDMPDNVKNYVDGHVKVLEPNQHKQVHRVEAKRCHEHTRVPDGQMKFHVTNEEENTPGVKQPTQDLQKNSWQWELPCNVTKNGQYRPTHEQITR